MVAVDASPSNSSTAPGLPSFPAGSRASSVEELQQWLRVTDKQEAR